MIPGQKLMTVENAHATEPRDLPESGRRSCCDYEVSLQARQSMPTAQSKSTQNRQKRDVGDVVVLTKYVAEMFLWLDYVIYTRFLETAGNNETEADLNIVTFAIGIMNEVDTRARNLQTQAMEMGISNAADFDLSVMLTELVVCKTSTFCVWSESPDYNINGVLQTNALLAFIATLILYKKTNYDFAVGLTGIGMIADVSDPGCNEDNFLSSTDWSPGTSDKASHPFRWSNCTITRIYASAQTTTTTSPTTTTKTTTPTTTTPIATTTTPTTPTTSPTPSTPSLTSPKTTTTIPSTTTIIPTFRSTTTTPTTTTFTRSTTSTPTNSPSPTTTTPQFLSTTKLNTPKTTTTTKIPVVTSITPPRPTKTSTSTYSVPLSSSLVTVPYNPITLVPRNLPILVNRVSSSLSASHMGSYTETEIFTR
ncbi:cell wall protein DAN4-like [Pecten maximus]|uniref:cell wall protein DAN4-like n=1 Tax=Pecten maximus TaxID=6579 RepID=UPI001458F173|nr:cell wall protein DAN4-like [Pecten maximus]